MTPNAARNDGDGPQWWVVASLLLGLSALVGAVWGGLGLMGLSTLPPPDFLLRHHGPLIANGFFGTVISLERVVALDRPPYALIPFAAGVGSWAVVLGQPVAGYLLVVVASTGLVGIFVALYRRDPARHHAVMGIGAICWAAGALLLLLSAAGVGGLSVTTVVPWWAAFLILTIAGERLELARMIQPSQMQLRVFGLAAIAVMVGLAMSLGLESVGIRIAAVGFVGLAGWLSLSDVARRTASSPGLAGYIGRTLLSGYIWLAVGGALLVWFGYTAGGLKFDAQWHAIFVGFVLTMIFAHAPIMIRVFTGRQVTYHPIVELAPVMLHISLVSRLYGDLAVDPWWRLAGGLGHAAAILWFAATIAWCVRRN